MYILKLFLLNNLYLFAFLALHNMIECGVPISVISRKVGHSSVQVTDTYYSHFFESEFKQAANSMNDIFEKAQ